MKELGPNTKYELVERFDPRKKKVILVAHPINPIDHGPSREGVLDEPMDEMVTPTEVLDTSTIDRIKASRFTHERWQREAKSRQ